MVQGKAAFIPQRTRPPFPWEAGLAEVTAESPLSSSSIRAGGYCQFLHDGEEDM